jgi:hypothetical protein
MRPAQKTEDAIAIQSRLQRIEEHQIGKKEHVKLISAAVPRFLKGQGRAFGAGTAGSKERIERDLLEAEDTERPP